MALGEPLKGCKLSYKLSFLFLESSLVTTDVCLPVVCIVLDIVVPCVELALIASPPVWLDYGREHNVCFVVVVV